jgi:hypothetical protein
VVERFRAERGRLEDELPSGPHDRWDAVVEAISRASGVPKPPKSTRDLVTYVVTTARRLIAHGIPPESVPIKPKPKEEPKSEPEPSPYPKLSTLRERALTPPAIRRKAKELALQELRADTPRELIPRKVMEWAALVHFEFSFTDEERARHARIVSFGIDDVLDPEAKNRPGYLDAPSTHPMIELTQKERHLLPDYARRAVKSAVRSRIVEGIPLEQVRETVLAGVARFQTRLEFTDEERDRHTQAVELGIKEFLEDEREVWMARYEHLYGAGAEQQKVPA